MNKPSHPKEFYVAKAMLLGCNYSAWFHVFWGETVCDGAMWPDADTMEPLSGIGLHARQEWLHDNMPGWWSGEMKDS